MSQAVVEGSFPEFIHFSSGRRKSDEASHSDGAPPPPPVSSIPAPADGCFRTPTKPEQAPRGILKSSSYKFTGRRVKATKPVLKQAVSTTPTTVETRESNGGSSPPSEDEASRTSSSCESSTLGSISVGTTGSISTLSTTGLQTVVDKILGEMAGINQTKKTKKKTTSSSSGSPGKPKTPTQSAVAVTAAANPSSSTSDVESVSTSSTSQTSTSSTAYKEELQRRFRIKHIENLNERINAAKARKLVERKAYRREDKLLVRLARQLKTVVKLRRENDLNIRMLEESNRICEKMHNESLDELEKLRSSRTLLQERLRANTEEELANDREQRARILRVQKAELEAHKRNHQFRCQALCESILEADNEQERMKAAWEYHFGEGKARRTRRSQLAIAVTVVVLAVLTAIAGGGSNATSSDHLSPEGSMVRAEVPLELPELLAKKNRLTISSDDNIVLTDDASQGTNASIPISAVMESLNDVGDEEDGFANRIQSSIHWESSTATRKNGIEILSLQDIARHSRNYQTNTNDTDNITNTEARRTKRKLTRGQQHHRFQPIHAIAGFFRKTHT